MELLHNPQQLSEKLLAYVRGSNEHFGIRLLICNFISRLIGCHQLILLGFYSYIQRYLTSHQEHVTQILSYLVQSCHDLIPPEVLQPVVKSIANNFVTERCSSEVMTVGLNAIREVYVRVPLVLEGDEMAPLVEELTDFTKNRDKSITIAARSFINAIREIDPMLLHRNQRGKFYDAKLKPTAYGATVVREGVDGAELLQKAIEEGRIVMDDLNDADEWNGEAGDSDDDLDMKGLPSDDEEDDGNLALGGDSGESGSDEDDGPEDGGNPRKRTKLDADPAVESENIVAEKSKGKKQKQQGRIDVQRILTPKDFERIEQLKLEMAEMKKNPKNRSRKRQRAEESDSDSDDDEDGQHYSGGGITPGVVVNPEDLEGYSKKRRQNVEERLKSVLEGREKWQHNGKSGGGSTNKEKSRHKNYTMMRVKKVKMESINMASKCEAQLKRERNKKLKGVSKLLKKKRRKF